MTQRLRTDRYAPIREYAAIGDGRTVALVARDGAIDWLCLPDLDSPSVFAALLDPGRGGRFALAPEVEFESTRRYVPGTNVLETTFETATGVVRVTDALTLPASGFAPYRELVRRIEGVSGAVAMGWRFEPRLGYGEEPTRISLHGGMPVASAGGDAVALSSWGAGEPLPSDGALEARFDTSAGEVAHLVLSVASQEPLVYPARTEVEARLEATATAWREWSDGRTYSGPWREAVVRSALALKLLVFAPSGAIAAAPTTSLPAEIGGERNWDYRYAWARDAAFTLRALLALGCSAEAEAFFSWLLHASQITHPKVAVLYRLNGRHEADERALPLAGYRGSRPVRVGNGAAGQLQLDTYGEVLEAAAEYARFTGTLDRDHAKRLAGIADFVCTVWREPDAGIWETRSEPKHFTQSKMMCHIALDRACELAEEGLLKGDVESWSRERDEIRRFVETRCYSERKASYTRSAGDDGLDAALLLGVLGRYDDPSAPRLRGTVDAVRRELGRGALVRRYLDDDGLPGEDGAFLACSFWLVDAYARQGRLDEATALMDELVEIANDVGLYAEQVDARTNEFLGNFPQGLSHLALINAAVAIAEASR